MDIKEIRDELAKRRDQYRECRDERLVTDKDGCTRTPAEGHEFHMYTSYQGSYAAMQSAVEWLDKQFPFALDAQAEYAAEHAPGYVMIAGAPYPHKDLSSATVEDLLEAIAEYYIDKRQYHDHHASVAAELSDIDAAEDLYELGGNKSSGIRAGMGLLYDRYYESALCLDERLQAVLDILRIIRNVIEATRGE